ncbi:MAG: LptA/OstA family protein [Pseudomonadota bacterium]
MTRAFLTSVLLLAAGAALAQGTSLAVGLPSFNASTPVEVSADALSVDQATGAATFEGNVLVVQGDVRLSAAAVAITYASSDNTTGNGIEALEATGGVTFVTASDAAEASRATYTIATGIVVMSGDVLLTQGQAAISGDRLVIDLNSGTGRMEGRVRTVIGGGN